MVNAPETQTKHVFVRSLRELRGFRRWVALLLGLQLLATPLYLLVPLPLKIAVDSVLGDAPLPAPLSAMLPSSWIDSSDGRLIVAAVLTVLVVVLVQARELAAYALSTAVGERIVLRFRARLFRHAQRLSMQWHDQEGTSDTVFRVQYDAMALRHLVVDGLVPLIGSAVALCVLVTVIFGIDPVLALVALAVIPPVAALTNYYRRRIRPQYKDAAKLQQRPMHVVTEVISALRVVKAFGREEVELDRFEGEGLVSARAQTRLATLEGVFGLVVATTTAAGTATVLYLGVHAVESGRITLGELLLVTGYLAQLYEPVKAVSNKVAGMQASMAGMDRAFTLMDQDPDVPEKPHARPMDRAEGTLTLDRVSFAYGDDPPVLEDVSLEIPAGARVGIVGRTGAGKSTLVNLLPRFADPIAGRILLDGVDLRDLVVADVRRQFAVVPQDTILFSTTVRENIGYARSDATEADIVDAARLARAHAFISDLPEGYDTVIGERGMRLSGGERQRLAIARAFLKDAPILILDEPTSALDTATESKIIEAMEALMVGRTTLMIAHRLSTLESCDYRIEVRDRSAVLDITDPERARVRLGTVARPDDAPGDATFTAAEWREIAERVAERPGRR